MKKWVRICYQAIIKFNYSLFTISYSFEQQIYGGVAQLARAPALQAGGQEFDSPQLHQPIIHDKLQVYLQEIQLPKYFEL